MPVNDTNLSSQVATSSSATVQLYYYNAGVRTTDAGQAAGTVVDAVFAHKNIQNSLGTSVASKNDTSLAYTCNALTTELELEARPDIKALMEGLDYNLPYTKAVQVGALLNNGEFVIDYRRGLLIGKKATTTATMTGVTYKYSTGVTVTVDSEFPAAAAITDNFANPTTTSVMGMGMVYDGSAWDMLRGDSTNGALVNLGTNNDVTVTGTVTADTELPAAAVLADATANPTVPTVGSGNLTFNGTTWDRARSGVTSPTATLTGMQNVLPMGEYNSSAPTLTNGQVDNLQLNASGHLKNQEQYAPTAEDNTSYTYYTTLRPIATAADPNTHANIMTVVNSTALEASHVLKAAPGRFYYARVEIDSTATTGTYYVQLINSATLPADGAVTLLIAPIKVHHTNGTTSAVEIDRGLYGVYASAGIVVTVSTTQYTKTIITSNWMNAEGHVA